MQLYSLKQVAEQLGCSPRTVNRHCAAAGIGRRLGTGPRSPWMLTKAEITQVKALIDAEHTGQFAAGNDFWKNRKKASESS